MVIGAMSVIKSFDSEINIKMKITRCSAVHPKYGQCLRDTDIGGRCLSGIHLSEIQKKNEVREFIEWSENGKEWSV